MDSPKDVSMRFSGKDSFDMRSKDKLLPQSDSTPKKRTQTLKKLFSRKKSAVNDDISSVTSYDDT